MDKFTAIYAKMIDRINKKIHVIKEQASNLEQALQANGFTYDDAWYGWVKPLGKDNLELVLNEGNPEYSEGATITIQGIEDYNETDPMRAEPGYFQLIADTEYTAATEDFPTLEEAIRAIGAVPPGQRYLGEPEEDPDVDSNCKELEINAAYDIIANVAKMLDGGIVTEGDTDGDVSGGVNKCDKPCGTCEKPAPTNCGKPGSGRPVRRR